MKAWKTFKDKEVVVGLIIIIILAAIALSLLIRREVQHQEKETIATGVSDDEEVVLYEEAEEIALSSIHIVTQDDTNKVSQKQKKEVSLYGILGSEKYTPCSLTERKQEDGQLKELFEYWDAYKLDAVAELVRLERLQKVSKDGVAEANKTGNFSI